MTVKELKDLLNSKNVFDNAEINIDIQDADGGNSFDIKDIAVDFEMGGTPSLSIIGSADGETHISSTYADTDGTAWDEYEYVFNEKGEWVGADGMYNCHGELE